MRSRVACVTRGSPRSARDTVGCETPAARATSWLVGGRSRIPGDSHTELAYVCNTVAKGTIQEDRMRIIDLSQEIYEGMPVYAGHLETKVWQHHTFADTAPNFDSDFAYQSLGRHVLRPRADARRRAEPSRPAAGRADDRPDGPRAVLRRRDVPGRVGRRAARVRRPRSTWRARCRSRRSSCVEGDVLLLRTGRPSATAAPRSTRRSTPGSIRARRTGCASGGRRCSASTRRAPTTRPTASTRSTSSAARAASRTTRTWRTSGRSSGRRFRFFGFPLRIRGGHGSPVRAVAMLRLTEGGERRAQCRRR